MTNSAPTIPIPGAEARQAVTSTGRPTSDAPAGQLPSCHDCGAEAFALFPGTEEDRLPLGIVIDRGVPGFGLCLPHARAHGWPNLPHERAPQ